MSTGTNPIIWSDYPDLDIIRVEDTYYMISTTMHMMPGGAILRSYDLIHWEIATYLYETLDGTPAQRLEGGDIYGQGMWAPCLRFHNGIFYVVFSCNDTKKTYLYQSDNIMGPWKKQTIEGFYHDCCLLFDDDGRTYLISGGREIRLTELNEDLSAPRPDGLHRVLVRDSDSVRLGFEGSHIYKINGKYYLFMIHWLSEGTGRRTQACWMAESLEGEFTGRDVLDDDMGYHNAGVAQGGIVDSADGKWYAMLFQDHGAVGRIPVLVPFTWQNDFPVPGIDGKVPVDLATTSTRPGYQYPPLFESDDFDYNPGEPLKKVWQWNHEPQNDHWSVTERPGHLRLRTDRIVPNVVRSVNTLTQRTFGPACEGTVLLDGSCLQEGDYAGLCILQSHYACIALTVEAGQYAVVLLTQGAVEEGAKPARIKYDSCPSRVQAYALVEGPVVELKVECDFEDNRDVATFHFRKAGEWVQMGEPIHFRYLLDHFMGNRFGLFMYSTSKSGGYADFDSFSMKCFGSPNQ